MENHDLDIWNAYQKELFQFCSDGQLDRWTKLYPRITNLANMTPREAVKNQRLRCRAAASLYLDCCWERNGDAVKADFHSDVHLLLRKKTLYLLFRLENSHTMLIAYGPPVGQAAYQEISETKKDQDDGIPDESAWSKERMQFYRINGMEVRIMAELLCRDIAALR